MKSTSSKSTASIPVFIALTVISSLFVIDFLPHSSTIDILYSQFFFLSLVNFLTAIYLYNKRKSISNICVIFKKSYLFWSYLTFILLSGLSFVATKNSSLVIEKIIELVIALCLFINLTILLKNRLYLLPQIVLIISISAFLQSSIELYYLKQKANQTSLLTALGFMAERAGNINILATSLAIKVPFLLIGITRFSGFKKVFLFLTLLSLITTLFLTGSRTAIISIFIVYVIYTFYYFKTNSLNRSSLSISVTFFIPLILSFFIANSIFKKTDYNSRYVSINDRLRQINNEDASVNTRLLFWNNTIQIVKKNPVLGVGLGNYKIESIPYEKTQMNDSTISLHSHNDFLEITAETGILNGLLYISIFVFIFFINIKRLLKSNEIETNTIAVLVLMIATVYVLDSLLNFPMFRPTMLLFLCLILTLTLANTTNKEHFEFYSENKMLYLGQIFICFITIYFAFLGYRASNLEYLIQKDITNSFSNSALTGEELIAKLPKYKNTLSTAESFYEHAGIYLINEKKYGQALKYLSKADKINPHFGRIFFYKMIIANATGNRDSAYIYAKKAFYLRPRNLNFYKMSTQFARVKNDTLEILKEHSIFVEYRKIPQAWEIAAEELQKAHYSNKKTLDFIISGLKEFPTDSILLQQKRNISTAERIKEGQSFLNKKQPSKALAIYKKALNEDPHNVDIMQNIAFYYYNFGDYRQSLKFFLNALELREFKSGRTEFFIGNCYLKINDNINACKYFTISKTKKFSDAEQLIIENCM